MPGFNFTENSEQDERVRSLLYDLLILHARSAKSSFQCKEAKAIEACINTMKEVLKDLERARLKDYYERNHPDPHHDSLY